MQCIAIVIVIMGRPVAFLRLLEFRFFLPAWRSSTWFFGVDVILTMKYPKNLNIGGALIDCNYFIRSDHNHRCYRPDDLFFPKKLIIFEYTSPT